jgi:hypothetical protein
MVTVDSAGFETYNGYIGIRHTVIYDWNISMSQQQTMVYYDGYSDGVVWIPGVYQYDSFNRQAFLKREGVFIDKNVSIMPKTLLADYAQRNEVPLRAAGRLIDDGDQGTRIVMYDDGSIRTATEERLRHPRHRIVVAPEKAVYRYMALHAKDHALTVAWGETDGILDKYVIGLNKPADTRLADLVTGRDHAPRNEVIKAHTMMQESYEAIEATINARLDEAYHDLYDQHQDAVATDTAPADPATDDTLSRVADPSDAVHDHGDSSDDHMAVISLDREYHQITVVIVGTSNSDWDQAFKVAGMSLIDNHGRVLAEGPQDNKYTWTSLPVRFIFDDVTDQVLEQAVAYRLNLTAKQQSTYKLESHDHLLPSSISATQYADLSDFMKSKYSVDETREITDRVDYRIIEKTTRTVADIMANKPISRSLGLLIKEVLGYNDHSPNPEPNAIGSVMIHDGYRISELVHPYDGATSPRYPSDRRRRRTPISHYPVYGSKKWTLNYDSDVWPMVYGRSYDDMLEQARTVLASFDASEATTEKE